jgi:phytoene dehydrogenase-like protein
VTATSELDQPVVVIGAGTGGLVAAARLTLEGVPVLLLEGSQRLGGRFSTIEVDGYKVPTGAVAIETAGPFWDTFGLLGIDAGLRTPDPPVMIHVRGRDLRPGAAVWQHMIKRVTKAAGTVAESLTTARSDAVQDDITLDQWVRRYTRSKTLLSLFQSLAASIFTVNADELPAGAFFRLLKETGGYKSFGFAPHGNVVIADAIGEAIVGRGGQVRRGWTVEEIIVEGDRAVGVRAYDPGGSSQTIGAGAVVSNVGPRGTAAMVKSGEASARFAQRAEPIRPSSMLALAFSSSEELIEHPGIWTFTDTERLCNLANLTATCPELAPPGRHLYEAYSCPRPSVGGVFDADAERLMLERDLERQIPGYEHAETVHFKVMRGELAPAQQCQPGYDPDQRTPLDNVIEVGDGVKPYGWIGTTACAETARRATELLVGQLLGRSAA